MSERHFRTATLTINKAPTRTLTRNDGETFKEFIHRVKASMKPGEVFQELVKREEAAKAKDKAETPKEPVRA